jgi:23S rRNA (adenine2503-C2)-methyltransferase
VIAKNSKKSYQVPMQKKSIYQLNFNELNSIVESMGHNDVSTRFIFKNLYKTKKRSLKDCPNLSPKLIDYLYTEYDFKLPKIDSLQVSSDTTTKFLMKFEDNHKVETVLLPFHRQNTLCLSTQVGCGMNCSFCHTATQGLTRHLDAHEIIGQYLKGWEYQITHWNCTKKPQIVFMGQGEPLHNFENLKKAIHILTDKKAIDLSPRQITLSTVGYLPGLKRLDELSGINIALSLHSPFEEERNRLIPINRRFPLDEVMGAIDEVAQKNDQYVVYEYLLIKNMNDTKEHAFALSEKIKGKKALVNIIPFNPFPGSSYQRPDQLDVSNFKDYLVEFKVRTMIRTTKGSDILAACGQLKSKEKGLIS